MVYYCANRTGWPSYPAPKTIWTTVAAFYAMGGTPTYASHTYNVGNPYGALPSASKSDFAFRGWWTAPSGLGHHVYTNSLVPYITTPHSLYADWALYPAIGGEFELQFMPEGMAFDLPSGFSGGSMEYATTVTHQAWNFVPLPADEYEITNGTVVILFSTNRPLTVYRAVFTP